MRTLMEETRTIKDRFSIKDRESMMIAMPDFPKEMKQNKGIWRRTEVLCGFGDIIENPNGKSSFASGCPFTTSENMVPIGGVQYMMEDYLYFYYPILSAYQSSSIGLYSMVSSIFSSCLSSNPNVFCASFTILWNIG